MSLTMKSVVPYLAGALAIAAALIAMLVVVSIALYGQSRDAKLLAQAAEEKVLNLAKRVGDYEIALDELSERQQLSMATLAARADHDAAMQGQLSALRRDLNGVMNDDPKSAKWGAELVPDAIAERVWNIANDSIRSAENNPGIATGISDR